MKDELTLDLIAEAMDRVRSFEPSLPGDGLVAQMHPEEALCLFGPELAVTDPETGEATTLGQLLGLA